MREGFLAPVAGARYLGYPVDDDLPRALKAYYEYCRRHRVPRYGTRGRHLVRREDLDRAVGYDPGAAERQLELRMLRADLPEQKRRA